VFKGGGRIDDVFVDLADCHLGDGEVVARVVLTERRRVNSAGTRPVVRETACGSGQWETGAAKVVKTRERILGYSRAGAVNATLAT